MKGNTFLPIAVTFKQSLELLKWCALELSLYPLLSQTEEGDSVELMQICFGI